MRLPVFLVEDGLITDAQVRRLREKRMSGKTLAAAAAAAGMSERTARHWQSGALPSTAKAPRTWRTREDPFAGVWESEVVPQLVAEALVHDSKLTVNDPNPEASHRPILYDSGRPSSVIWFRTLHATTDSATRPPRDRARSRSPIIDLYRKNAFSTRAWRW